MKRRQFISLRIVVDLLMISFAWVAAYYLRFATGLATPLGVPPPSLYFKLIPFIWIVWAGIFFVAGFYRRTGQHRSAFTEGLDIIQSCTIAAFAFIAFTYFYEEYRYSRLTMVFFAVLNPIFMIAGRSLVRKLLRRYSRRLPRRGALLIGGGSSLRSAFDLLRMPSIESYHVAGVVLVGQEADDESFCQEQKLPMLSPPSDWPTFFTEHPVQTVLFALPHGAYNFLEHNLDAIVDQVPDIKLVPDIMRYTRFSPGIEMIGGMPVINIHESPLAGFGGVLKRCLDVLGACTALVLFAPVMVAIACLVPLSSRGPVLFRQKRMGLDGKMFDCLKFRSMPVDAEAKTGAVWATADDSRPTWLGRFLRRTSLDELPQLFNVLHGDMSLVGPRPERPVFVNQFRKKVPGYMLRHKVKAGMTGWAQVNGWRGNTSIEKRIEYDLFYIQNWSIWLDLKILVMTVEELLFGHNAY